MKSVTRRILTFVTSLCVATQPLLAAAAGYQYQVPFDAPNMAQASTGALSLSPASHAFGTLVLGSTAVTSTTIKNIGQDSVHVDNIGISGPFTQSNNCPAILVGGQSCQATVVFNPSAAGNYTASLDVAAQESGASVSFAVSGNAVVPTTNLSLAPSSVSFGASDVGVSAAAKSVSLTNDGNSPATVSGIAVSSGTSDFSQSNNCGATLAPGAHCTINLGFNPTVYGARTGGLSVYEEASGTLYNVALQGSGNAAVMAVSPAAVTMPNTIVGYPTTAKVTVSNAGNLPLLAVASNVSGASADFSIADSQCGASLAAGTSCDITISFAPAGAGNKSATLAVTSNNGGQHTVALTGTGVAQAPDLTASPANVTFTAYEVGTPSPAQTVTLTNHGNIPVVVSGLGVVVGASDFAQTNNCATVPVNGSCVVNVQFTPALRGTRTGTVYLRYDTRDLTINLSGQGLQGIASPSANSVDFGSVQVGKAATSQSITLTNTGDAPLVVQSALVPSSDYTASTACTTVAPGASCSVQLAFTPSALGSRLQTLTITTNAGAKTIALQGNGVKGNASVSPSSVTFQPTQAGTTAVTQNVTVTNTGTNTLNFTGVGLVTGGADFAQSNNCAAVDVNSSCVISVSFTPSVAGIRSGVLALTHDGDGVTTVALSGEGRDASATLSPLSFATTHVGATATATSTLTNTGIGVLTLTVPSASSVTGTDFSFVSTTCGNTVSAGATCLVTVRFAPTSTTPRNGALNLAANAGTQTATLTATGVQGTASASPSALTFSAQQVASTSTAQSVTVTNTGTSPLVFSGVGVVSGASDFAQSNDCASVAVGSSCSITVTFTPTVGGNRSGTVALTHDGAGLTTVSLSGTGQGATATLSTPVFNTTQVGGNSTATATLTNTGIGSIAVTPATASSVAGTDFSFVSTTCGNTLAVGATCATVVRFAPTSTAARSGSLSFATEAGSKSAALAATGVQGTASVTPGSLTFAAQQTGSTSATQAVTVTNTGTSTLTFTGVGIASGAAHFAQSNNCASVAVNGTCVINVNFTPSASGPLTGSVALTHDGGGVATVNLSGTGQVPSATLTLSSFPATPVGSSGTATATLSNTGIGALSITTPSAASVTGADYSYVGTTCTTSIAVSGSCTVTVKFSPTSTAVSTGNLAIPTAAGTQSAALSSVGIQGSASASPAALTFSAQQVASSSTTQAVTVTNGGTNTLTYSGVSVTTGATDFSQTNNCAAVSAGANCVITVTFTPSTTGVRSGVVTLAHNGQGTTSINLSGTGQAQAASLTTPSFASTAVGASNTATATLSNTGIGSLSVTTPSAASVAGTDFSFVSTTCGTSLAVSGTCTVTVKFSPTSTSARSGTLSVSTGAGTQSVSLGSTGIQGFASISPSSLSYAAQQTSTTSSVQVVTVTNTGTNTLTFAGVGISSGASDFAQSNNCASVAVNGTCTVNVSFTPSATGARPGTLAFTHDGGGIATVSLSGTGQNPSATLSSPAFTATQVGSNSTATATLTNTGVGLINVTTPTAASITGADFAFVSTNCGTSLTAGATCSITVKFTPGAIGARSGALSFATGAGTQTATLSGSGIAGNSSPSPTSLTFSTQQVSATSGAQTVTVTNNGSAPLTIGGVTVTAGASDFAQSNSCGTPLAINGSCAINVSFTPSAAGTRTGTVTITHDGTGATSFGLTGTGQLASATLSSPSFSSTQVSSNSTANATLSNTGLATISVTTPSAASVTGTDFSFVSTTCGTSLSAGTNCTVTVKFAPTSNAARSGTLSFATGAGTASASLSATGVQGAASYAPTSLTFSTLQVGSSSTAQSVTLTNNGTSTLTVNSVSVTSGATDFTQTNTCTSVAVSGNCSITVTFTPTAGGARSGTVTVAHNGTGSTTIGLSGTGQAPSATLSTPNFAATQVGSSNTATSTLANTGIAAISVTTPVAASVTGTDFSFVSTTCGTSLGAGTNCTVTVRFSPTSNAARTGSLSFATGAGTQTATLSATGSNPSVTYVGGQSFSFNAPNGTSSGHYTGVQNNGVGPVTVNSLAYTTTAGNYNAWWVAAGSGSVGGYCANGFVLQPGESCGAWSNGDGAIGSTSSGTTTISTSAGNLTFNGSFTVRGLTYSTATGATTSPTSGQTGTLYTMSIVNSTPFNFFFPMYTVYGGASRVGRFTGGNAGNFVITGTTCAGTLAAGGSCTVSIAATGVSSLTTYSTTFQPNGSFQQVGDGTAGSWSNGSWLVNMGTTVADVYVAPTNAVNVTAQAASMGLSSTSAAFGNVQVGQSTVSGTYTLTNSGNIAATSVAVNPGAGYSITSNTCGATLNAGANCTFTLTFAPAAAQAYNNNASVTSSAGTQTITVTGTGTNPSLYLSGWNTGGTAAMGVVGYNSDSGRWPIYTNNGSGPVVIQSHSSNSAFWAWQGQSGYCYPGLTVAAGASCVFFNGVSSAGVGDYSGSSTVVYTGAGQSTQFSTGVPNYTASIRTTTSDTASIAFSTQPQNTWNGPRTVTITNNATNNPLQNIAISFSGGNSGNFTSSGGSCGTTLAGGASCTINVYFNPTWSANGFSSTLVVTGGYPRMQPGDSGYIPSNTSVNINVPVSGNGAYSQATLISGSSISLGQWYGGGAVTGDFIYRNDGNVAMTLANPSVSSPLSVPYNDCSNIGPTGTCTQRIALTSTANYGGSGAQGYTASGATIAPSAVTANWVIYSASPVWGSTSLAFGNVPVNTTASQNVTLYNYGSSTAYNWAANNGITNLPAGFTIDLSACSNVAPGSGNNAQGGNCNAVVNFKPTAVQSYGGGSVYVSAASYLNNTLTVSGAGISPTSASYSPGNGTSLSCYRLSDGSDQTNCIVTVSVTGSTTVGWSYSNSTNIAGGGTCTQGGTLTNGSCTISFTRSGSGTSSASTTGTLSVTTGIGTNANFPYTATWTYIKPCTCPATWEVIETLERGFIPVGEVEAGMHLRAGDGQGWNEVYGTTIETANLYRLFVGGEAVDVNDAHLVMMADGSWRRVVDLVEGDVIKGQHGENVTVTGVVELGKGAYRAMQVENHNYQLGHTVGHNVSVTC